MKRFTMIVALLLIVAMPMMAERVTPEAARKVASTFLNNNGAKSAQLTDLSKEAGFTNLYIFNGNPGFVVMAADDCVKPILGYSLTGKFVVENMPTNVSGWLQGYNDEIQYAIDSKMSATSEVAQLWRDLAEGNSKAAKATVVVDALIQTTWDQDPGYNDLCPYDSDAGELTVTGCVATAMAQIMRYWEYPSHGVGSHSYTPNDHPEYGTQSVNFADATYDWTQMPLYSSSDEIAKLMYHCGVSVDMEYGIGSEGGSAAYNSNIAPAFQNYFNYKTTAALKWKDSYSGNWIDLLKTELNAGRPIEYNGSGSGGGHAFVCDGYDNTNYFHFNWGWSGRNDGFFSLTNLNPGSGGSGGGSYNFTESQSAVIGIQPKDCTVSTPTNFSVAKEGRNAVLTWTAASNAASYSIYKDGLLYVNITGTTYTDSNLSYGSYAYYVKSVDSNGAKSSPTSTLTVAIEPVASNLTVTKNGDNAILNWTEPEWCLPQTDDEVLTYNYVSPLYNYGTGGSSKLYYGHKYSASLINSNKVLYKVSFFAAEIGAYKLFVYTANSGNNKPQTQVYTQDVTVSVADWTDIVLSSPLQLDDSKDLWVFIYDPIGRAYPIIAGTQEGTDINESYVSFSAPTSGVSKQDRVILINTYITDGSFYYILYDNNTSIASNISGTSHTLSSITNNTAHQYTLKTIFNNSVTTASNMAGLTVGNASLNSLTMAANDKMTVTEGSKLTVSGTLINENAANLILENSAQLVNSSESVQATVKKDITAYTANDNGWYFIASPVLGNITPSEQNGLLANDYDLYIFDQSQALEWRNYEGNPKPFTTIDNKKGYLYANSGNTTLNFAGTLAASTDATSLAYVDNATFKGFNLIGNPYPCNTTIINDFYIISGNTVTLAERGRAIAPCEGIFVKATNANESVIFTKDNPAKGMITNDHFDLVVLQGKAIVDRARVRFGEGEGMEKLSLGDKHSPLSLWQNGQDYAVAYADGANEIPVSFKAAKNGTYTLNIESKGIECDYLHLIDNMTGADIDLLHPEPLIAGEDPQSLVPSYTFQAKTTDYESRFKLVFSESTPVQGDLAAFANYADGVLHVFSEGKADLQIVDITGRILCTETFSNSYSKTLNLSEGVYIIRLTQGNETKTQKVVVK